LITISLPDILNQCIDDVKAGRVDITDCLGDTPYLKIQLMPLVTTALQITRLPDVAIPDSLWVWGVNWFLK
jgi:hypothetical protein